MPNKTQRELRKSLDHGCPQVSCRAQKKLCSLTFSKFCFYRSQNIISSFEDISSFENIEETRYLGHLKSSDPNIRISSPHRPYLSFRIEFLVHKRRFVHEIAPIMAYAISSNLRISSKNRKSQKWKLVKTKIFPITVIYHSNGIPVFAACRCVLHY